MKAIDWTVSMAQILKMLKDASFSYSRITKPGEISFVDASVHSGDTFLMETRTEYEFWISFTESEGDYELVNVEEGFESPGKVRSLQLKFPSKPIQVLRERLWIEQYASINGSISRNEQQIAKEDETATYWRLNDRIYKFRHTKGMTPTIQELHESADSWEVTRTIPSKKSTSPRKIRTLIDSAEFVTVRTHRNKADRQQFEFTIKDFNSSEPILIGEDRRERFWLYEKDLYVTDDRLLDAADVSALLNEESNKRRIRLEKAHALAAMSAQLDSKTKRKAISQDVKTAVWQRDHGRCVECESRKDLEFDHIIPLAMGGSNTIRNLQLLCEPCNRRKGASLG